VHTSHAQGQFEDLNFHLGFFKIGDQESFPRCRQYLFSWIMPRVMTTSKVLMEDQWSTSASSKVLSLEKTLCFLQYFFKRKRYRRLALRLWDCRRRKALGAIWGIDPNRESAS
jgi:hypothetical protein